jgi:hypothetical protein
MSTGDDADRFRVPRWISDDNSGDGRSADGPPTTEDSRWPAFDGDEAQSFIAGPRRPSLNAGEPLWPAAADRGNLPGPPPDSADWPDGPGEPRAGMLDGTGQPRAGMRAAPGRPRAGMPAAPGRRTRNAPAAGSLPPPVTKGQREAAEPQRRGLLLVVTAAAVVVIVAVGFLVKGATGGAKTPTAGSAHTTAGPAPQHSQAGNNTSPAPAETPSHNNAFAPLTIEAESPENTLSGSAIVVDYPNASGGKIVRDIGDWQLPRGPGTLRFNNIDAPRSGNYTLAFSYVDTDNQADRAAVIDISGRTGMVITVGTNNSCCRTQTVQVPLRKGKNTIAFSNRTSQAPSIDRIVVSLP